MEEVLKLLGNLSQTMTEMDKKLSEVVNELRETKKENQRMRDIISQQDERIGILEREVRKKNLIFKGVEDKIDEKPEETKRKVLMICQMLEVNINPEVNIDDIQRLGKPRPGTIRPIILKLTTSDKKWEILKKSNKLKGTDIWVDEDYPKKIQEDRALLIPELKKARSSGKRAQLRYDKLIVDGKIVNTSAAQTTTTELKTRETTTGNKRKTDMRSPEAAKLEEQLKKITRTAKNGSE